MQEQGACPAGIPVAGQTSLLVAAESAEAAMGAQWRLVAPPDCFPEPCCEWRVSKSRNSFAQVRLKTISDYHGKFARSSLREEHLVSSTVRLTPAPDRLIEQTTP